MVETRRSSSSKRALSASPPPNPKRSKASDASSSNNGVRSGPPAEPLGPIKESGSQPPELELRSSDPPTIDSLKAINGPDATALERSPDDVAEGEALVSPQPLGETAVRAGLKRGKKLPKKKAKLNSKSAWGMLISQFSKVYFVAYFFSSMSFVIIVFLGKIHETNYNLMQSSWVNGQIFLKSDEMMD
ncbi:hypothetical protein FF1_008191 [Malus domestica]